MQKDRDNENAYVKMDEWTFPKDQNSKCRHKNVSYVTDNDNERKLFMFFGNVKRRLKDALGKWKLGTQMILEEVGQR